MVHIFNWVIMRVVLMEQLRGVLADLKKASGTIIPSCYE